MDGDEADFLRGLRETFRAEAIDHLSAIVRGLDELRSAAGEEERRRAGEGLLRHAHSLKGAARAVNDREVEHRALALETAFSRVRAGGAAPDAQEVDRWLAEVDELMDRVGAHSPRPGGAPAPASPEAVPTQGEAGGTVRVPAALLDRLYREVRDLLPLVADEGGAGAAVAGLLADGAGAGVTDPVRYRLQRIAREDRTGRRGLQNRVGDLLSLTYAALLTPASGLLEAMARTAREQARAAGKELDVALAGGELEIDRYLLDALVDPLVHLVTNAVAHGIEPPAVRRQLGKPSRGRLAIELAIRPGRRVEVRVADDGAGMDTAAIRAAAVASGVIGEEDAAALSERDARRLAFYAGVSTSPVTLVAGRGVGLSTVRERVERLGGRITIESARGEGTVVTLVLPMTLLSLRGLVVRVGGERVVVPLAYVNEVLSRRADEVVAAEGGSAVPSGDRLVPVVHLADALERPRAPPRDDRVRVVMIETSTGAWGFAVDEVIGEETLHVQAFGPPLLRVRNLAGAAILPDGMPAPVLHAPDLVRSAIALAGTGRAALGPAPDEAPAARVLVVEDSITARTLLRTILAGAGYEVETATDGLDAWNLLSVRPFDLVVTDLAMPVMDGFALTRRIRQDPGLSTLPVVLVSALDAREDRERGMAAGANAFVVKGSFEQSNLLEAVRRLL